MDVTLSKDVQKSLSKIPKHIQTKLLAWAQLVRIEGLEAAKKVKGYHDEPLKGDKQGLHSIRLSLQWRAEYTHHKSKIEFIIVEEVHPHAYKK